MTEKKSKAAKAKQQPAKKEAEWPRGVPTDEEVGVLWSLIFKAHQVHDATGDPVPDLVREAIDAHPTLARHEEWMRQCPRLIYGMNHTAAVFIMQDQSRRREERQKK